MLYNKQKQFIKHFFIGLVFFISLGLFNSVHISQAKAANVCKPAASTCFDSRSKIALLAVADTHTPAKIDCNATTLDKSNCGIIDYLIKAINFLSGLVGLIIVAVIIIAGIQFSTAGNDPQKIAAAKGRIVNALMGLAVFIFMFAFLQWVVPGGLF